MRFDLTPYRRSTIGFDRLFDMIEANARGTMVVIVTSGAVAAYRVGSAPVACGCANRRLARVEPRLSPCNPVAAQPGCGAHQATGA